VIRFYVVDNVLLIIVISCFNFSLNVFKSIVKVPPP